MRGQRSGVFTTRRMDDTLLAFEHARHDFVGGDHEIFDQFGRAALLLLHDVHDFFVQDQGVNLDGLDVQRPVAVPLFFERLRSLILNLELRLKFRRSSDFVRALGPCSRARRPRRYTSTGPYSGRWPGRRCRNGRRRHVPTTNSITMLSLSASSSNELVPVESCFGQHRKIPDARINRCRFFARVHVDGGALWDEGIHVRDTHQNFCLPVWQALGEFNLVEIARSIVVDGGPEQIAQIANSRAGRDLRRVRSQFPKLLLNLGRKFRLKSVR